MVSRSYFCAILATVSLSNTVLAAPIIPKGGLAIRRANKRVVFAEAVPADLNRRSTAQTPVAVKPVAKAAKPATPVTKATLLATTVSVQ
jgi:hypothetical protein